MLSDDFIQNVNTNMKVGVSQCEWAPIFYRKTLPKQANISARSYSSDFVSFLSKWQLLTTSVLRKHSCATPGKKAKHNNLDGRTRSSLVEQVTTVTLTSSV